MAEIFGQELHLLGLVQVPSLGVRKGNIIDLESTSQSIETCLNELERLTGIEIFGATVGFSSVSISIVSNHAMVAVGNPIYEINEEDKQRVLQSARNISIPLDRSIIQTIVKQYIIDGFDGVKDPVGMAGSRLEAEVSVIVGAVAGIQNLQRTAHRINLRIDQLVYNSLLASTAVLSPTEKEMGVGLVDIGGGTIEISYFENGNLVYTTVLPMGDEYITKDLAIVLRTSMEEAAKIKENHGLASPDMANREIMLNVPNIQGKDASKISQQVVADIISARVIEMSEMIIAEFKQFGCLGYMPAGIVLTGGGAELAGITQVMEEYINIPVRLGWPENIKGINDEYNRPRNAAVLGGLLFNQQHAVKMPADSSKFSGIVGKVSSWFTDLFR
jgi:cell division protein FtsA